MQKSLGPLLSVLLLICAAVPAQSQIVYTLSEPQIDSFPIVRVGVNVTENGGPASLIIPQNFQTKEDGVQVGAFDLWGCGGTASAAIAFVVDTSSSMEASVGTGSLSNRSFTAFYDGFSKFLANIPGPSQIALVPFADTATHSYPVSNFFYNTANPADTTSLMAHLGTFDFAGGTDVDAGIVKGASVLSHGTLPRRVIVLVTDGAVTNASGLEAFLKAQGIALYVLEVARDSLLVNYANRDLAIATGGEYFAAYDPSLYGADMIAIANRIFSEHCTLRYISNAPCPYYRMHTVQADLNYKGPTRSAIATYSIGRTTHDGNPPRFSMDTISLLSRVVSASDPFPCESGMLQLTDSGLQNFKTLRKPIIGSTLATDSIMVIDSMYPADADYFATDSAGNLSRLHVHYSPKPDVHPPQFGQPVWNGGGVITLDVAEQLPWDRGIYSVWLQANTSNLQFDSIVYYSRRLARGYFHLINVQGSASGCLIARDSAGNMDTSCINWSGDTSDIYPPVFAQDPLAEPRVLLSGIVTDKRLFDKGIKTIIVTPLYNCSQPTQSFVNVREANVGAILTDSLYSARAVVEAYDSAGHYLRDTLRYEPLPDVLAPLLNYNTTQPTAFVFTASDDGAWDRGIASLQLLPNAVNATASAPVFTDTRHASLQVSVTDRTLNASMTVQATDSAGHHTIVQVKFVGLALTPFGDFTIDFGTVSAPAPASMVRTLTITNQNDVPVSLDLSALTGDDSMFRILTPSPVLFAPRGSQSLTFEFDPKLLGSWDAKTMFHRDTSMLGSVMLLARTTGGFSLALDTVNVARPEQSGVLHLSIDADPKPINLDTISFTLSYDPDVITVDNFLSCPNGSLDTGICLYDALWIGGADGNRQAMLTRHSQAQSPTLSFGRTELSIPFVAHLAKDSLTRIHLTATGTGSTTPVNLNDGLVTVGNICGTALIRYAMNGTLGVHIDGIAPNPASSSMELHVSSSTQTDASIRVISVLGSVVRDIPIHLVAGQQIVRIDDLPRTSGTYDMVLRLNGVDADRRLVQILR